MSHEAPPLATLPPLSQLIGSEAAMAELREAFSRFEDGMDFKTFRAAMQAFFPDQFGRESAPAFAPLLGPEPDPTDPATLDATLNARHRRLLARMELARVVPTDPLRLLFGRMDTRNEFALTWEDFTAYIVESASAAGVLSAVREDYRAYTGGRTRCGQPLPSVTAAGDSSSTAGGSGGGGTADGAASEDSDELTGAVMTAAEQRERQRVLRHVWRGHTNKYGGKVVQRGGGDDSPGLAGSRPPAKNGSTPGPAAQPRIPHTPYEPKDLGQIEFMDGLPTNPTAFAVSCRHRPLALFSKADFSLLRTFTAEELGGAKPSMVTYIAGSDTLLVYSAADGYIRGFAGLFSTSHATATAMFKVTAGLLRCWRHQPSVYPDCIVVAGSLGCIQNIRVPSRHGEAADGRAKNGPAGGQNAGCGSGAAVDGLLDPFVGRELRLMGSIDNVHSRVTGGISDFVMSDTHIFSCGFDHRILSINLATGVRLVIGRPDEAVRCLVYCEAFKAIVAVSFSTSELLLWDVRNVTTVPGTRFTAGDGEAGAAAGGATANAKIIGLLCPADMPHVISADTAGMVRVWDLRSHMCVQQVRADGVPETSEEEDPAAVYGSKSRVDPAQNGVPDKTSEALQLRARANRHRQRAQRSAPTRPGFDLSSTRRNAPTNTIPMADLTRGGSASAASRSRAQSDAGQTIVTCLAYFGATHEIVTCTADQIHTLQYHQRDDLRLCDIDFVTGVAHAIRGTGPVSGGGGGGASATTRHSDRGSLLLYGPSRLSLWDAAGGYRTRLTDRALNVSAPNSRREAVAVCLDDTGNRVFLSFPDGSLEVHDLRSVFEVGAAAQARELAADDPFDGVTIVPSAAVRAAMGKPRFSSPHTELYTELAYLSDQKLLIGITNKGRLLLRSEDPADTFCIRTRPAGVTAPLFNLTCGGELGLVAFSCTPRAVNTPSPPAIDLNCPGARAVAPPSHQVPPLFRPPRVPSASRPTERAAPQGSHGHGAADLPHRIFTYDYNNAAVILNPPRQMCLGRAVNSMTFLGDLPVLLTTHEGGDVVLWKCPPLRGHGDPVVAFNVFTGHFLPTPFPYSRSASRDPAAAAEHHRPATARERRISGLSATRGRSDLATSTRRSPRRGSAQVPGDFLSASISTNLAPSRNQNQRRQTSAGRCGSRPLISPKRRTSAAAEENQAAVNDVLTRPMGTEVTAAAFDPTTHRLFFGDSHGSVHIFFLCPTIQYYGLRPCHLEERRTYQLASPHVNASFEALPERIASHGVHMPMGSKGVATTHGVIALTWLPFLGVLLSSGEDRRVVALDRNGAHMGVLSAARLPSNSVSNGNVTDEIMARQLPFVLPEAPRFALQHALHLHTGHPAGQFIASDSDDWTAAASPDACRQSGCRRFRDSPDSVMSHSDVDPSSSRSSPQAASQRASATVHGVPPIVTRGSTRANSGVVLEDAMRTATMCESKADSGAVPAAPATNGSSIHLVSVASQISPVAEGSSLQPLPVGLSPSTPSPLKPGSPTPQYSASSRPVSAQGAALRPVMAVRPRDARRSPQRFRGTHTQYMADVREGPVLEETNREVTMLSFIEQQRRANPVHVSVLACHPADEDVPLPPAATRSAAGCTRGVEEDPGQARRSTDSLRDSPVAAMDSSPQLVALPRLQKLPPKQAPGSFPSQSLMPTRYRATRPPRAATAPATTGTATATTMEVFGTGTPTSMKTVRAPERRAAVAPRGGLKVASLAQQLKLAAADVRRSRVPSVVLPGTAEALALRIKAYERELHKCLRGGADATGDRLRRTDTTFLTSTVPLQWDAERL